jgi:MFS transporter, OFA family, oxalate/formate antiporter
MYIITQWFKKKRGVAVGVFLLGSSLGAAIFNPVSLALIAKFGWRSALMYLGIILFIGMLLPIFLLIKDRPEDVNSIPDGEIGNFVFIGDNKISLRDALLSPMFYLILLVTGVMWFCVVGVQQHQPLYLKDLAIDPTTTGFVVTTFFTCSIIGKIIFGWISDRFDKKIIMLSAMLCLAIGLTFLYLSNAQTINYLWIYAIVAGIGFSGTFTMIQILVAEYYQGESYGKILGVVTTIDTIAGVMGIATLAKIRDNSGTYQQGFFYLIVLCGIAILGGMFFKKPRVKWRVGE